MMRAFKIGLAYVAAVMSAPGLLILLFVVWLDGRDER